ncbi:MAG: hypothetical protein M0C28_46810 [Candidatus Moduliflexus flocculans]|nr:hypothetical protein [Candidatus Moduliflexus flocculans]
MENLNVLLAERRANVMIDTLTFDPSYLVTVTVNRFDGQLGDSGLAECRLVDPGSEGQEDAGGENLGHPGEGPRLRAMPRWWRPRAGRIAALSREIAAELDRTLK